MRGFVVFATLLCAVPHRAAAQGVDAGVPDAAPADAGSARVDAGAADVGPIADPELHRHEVTARDLAARDAELRRAKEAANAAEARALQDQAEADNPDELLLSAVRAELAAISADQTDYQRQLLADRAVLTARAKEHLERVKRVRAGFAAGDTDYDALFDDVNDALGEVLVSGVHDAGLMWRGRRQPPRPAPLGDDVLALAERWPAEVAGLTEERENLRKAANALVERAGDVFRERVDLDREHARELASMRVQLLGRVSRGKRDQLTGLRAQGLIETRLELVYVALQVGDWALLRLRQARGSVSSIDDLLALGEIVWSIIELLLILLVLRIALGRWDAWMTGLIASVGRSMHLGSGALFVARVAELARGFGPPLLVALSAVVAYVLLEDRRVAEVEIGFLVVFWVAIFRTQLRFVQAFSRMVGTRRAERRAQQRELDHNLGDESGPATLPPDEPDDLEPWWQTLSRSWHVATRYTTAAFILVALVEYGAGDAVARAVLSRVAWWGLAPLAVYFLHSWRRRIVFEYLRRDDSRDGFLAQVVERHAHRFYGSVVVVPALAIVVARQTAGFVRRNLSNLDATKRLFAWLFRRRVEKHAHELGRVLERVHELPEALHQLFPPRPLGPDDRPTKPACLAEIRALYDDWRERGGDGSVALVGASGMGKTTILNTLTGELGDDVVYARLITKVSHPESLYKRLARLLDLDGEPTTEPEIISLLVDSGRKVVCIDNCHNLFLRQVGGFQAWEAFAHLVNETSDKVFWVASFNDVAWDYLNNIAARLSYFRAIVRLGGWTDTEIRHLILSRMRRARLRPSFTDLVVTRLEGVSVQSQIIGTAQGYFRLLWDFTRGNPRDACHFWLRSLVPEEGSNRIRVHLFSAPRIEDLEELPDDIVFVLQAVVEHENLTADELTRVTSMSPEFCRFALGFCRDAGYLVRDPLTGRSQLSVHWHQTVLRFLKRQHLIYS